MNNTIEPFSPFYAEVDNKKILCEFVKKDDVVYIKTELGDMIPFQYHYEPKFYEVILETAKSTVMLYHKGVKKWN